jgi:hypothetical protein
MSLTSKNQLLIAFKKLVGKAHTNAQFGSANESVASNVQLDNSTIFAQPIPSAPNTTLYSITNNIVERVQFSLVSISLSQYTAVGAAGGGITADGDGAPTQGTFTNGIHAYALTLPSNYTTLSSNPKKGTGVFINGQSLTGSNGVLQVVPERYGASYPAQVSSSSGILAALDEEDYLLDPYSGILFLQDINRVPTSVTAYIYIGDYLNQIVSGSTAQFTTISASIVSASQYVGLPSFSAIPGGTDQTVQFNSGSTFSGSNQLTYNYNTNILSGTIARFSVVTSSFTGSGAGLFNLTASGISNFTNDVRGQFSAGTNITIVGGVISSTGGGGGTPGGTNTTIQFNSGSTFSGSTNLVFDYTNNILSGTVARFTTVTASLIGTASFATNAGNANTVTNGVYTNTNNTFTAVNTFSNFYITGSITGSDAKFISITGSHAGSGAGLTNIPNTGLVNSSVTVGSTNIALGGTATTLQGITVLTGSTITGSIALFSQITSSFSGNGANITNITASGISNFTNDVRSQFSAGTNITIVGGVISSTSGGGGTPGGTDQTLQFNSGSTFSGSTNLIYNYTTNVLSGTTAQFTTITASNGFISGGLTVGNYIQMLPVEQAIIPTNQTASYIYTSGSTNDLYFTQYQPGTNFNNTTRLRWMESLLNTGILHGGVLSTVNGTTSFSITSGSGIIVNFNASIGTDPYPTTKYITWPAVISQSLPFTGSAQITYISIDDDGNVLQSITAPSLSQFKEQIYLGRVLHQTGSVTNGAFNTPSTAYAVASNTADFIRTIGPLKISGHVLAASGSTLSLTKTSGDSYVEGRNYTNNPNIPNIVLAADDPAVTISKIYREHISGSQPVIDTGVGGAGYTTVDPTRYQDANGNLQTVGGTNFTVQRVFWFPKAVNGALFVYYGQERYTNLDDAIAGITTENFTEGDNTKGSAILVGFLVMRGNVTDFDTPNTARIYQASTFRGGGAGGGGGIGVSGVPGDGNGAVQYNDAGVFGGDNGFTYNKITHDLFLSGSITSLTTISGTTAQFSVITSSFTGSGAGLFNITASGITNFTNDVRSQFSAGANITINAGVISATTGSVIGSVITVTGNYIVLTTDDRIFTDGTLTLTLPSAVGSSGKSYYIKNIGTGSVTLTGTLGQKIDGYDNMIITEQNSAFGLLSNNVGWYIF